MGRPPSLGLSRGTRSLLPRRAVTQKQDPENQKLLAPTTVRTGPPNVSKKKNSYQGGLAGNACVERFNPAGLQGPSPRLVLQGKRQRSEPAAGGSLHQREGPRISSGEVNGGGDSALRPKAPREESLHEGERPDRREGEEARKKRRTRQVGCRPQKPLQKYPAAGGTRGKKRRVGRLVLRRCADDTSAWVAEKKQNRQKRLNLNALVHIGERPDLSQQEKKRQLSLEKKKDIEKGGREPCLTASESLRRRPRPENDPGKGGHRKNGHRHQAVCGA